MINFLRVQVAKEIKTHSGDYQEELCNLSKETPDDPPWTVKGYEDYIKTGSGDSLSPHLLSVVLERPIVELTICYDDLEQTQQQQDLLRCTYGDGEHKLHPLSVVLFPQILFIAGRLRIYCS